MPAPRRRRGSFRSRWVVHRLLAVTLGPLILILGLLIAARIARVRGKAAAAEWYIDLVLKLCFLVFTSTSTSIFQTFACDDTFDDGRSVLACDTSLSCKSPRHRAFKAYSAVMIFVYPVGIVCRAAAPDSSFRRRGRTRLLLSSSPSDSSSFRHRRTRRACAPLAHPFDRRAGLFATLLVQNCRDIDPSLGADGARLLRLDDTSRAELSGRCSLAQRRKTDLRAENENPTLRSISFLYAHYLPMFWWFEILESVRRLMVTAVAVTVEPGTSTQLAFGLLTSIASLLLYAVRRGAQIKTRLAFKTLS